MKVVADPQKLSDLLKPHDRSDSPGFAIGVAVEGRPVFRRGYGLASLDLPVLLTPTTRIRIGSTSKHFTALAVFLLGEKGKLSVDDSIRKHMPSLPDWAEPITLHQLMTHTSGMRCSLDLLSLTSDVMSKSDALPHAAQIALLEQLQSTNFAPGTDWSYCNGGYALLTRVIESLSGMSYGDFLREHIFAPAGMYDTMARPLDTDFVSGSATLHVRQPDGSYRRGLFGPEIGGEGNLISTVDDMLRWLIALRGRRLGSETTWDGMLRSGTVQGGDCGYAAGLVTNEWRGIETIFHTGGVVGGSSQMITVPSLELDVIVLANSSAVSAAALANQVLEACIEGLQEDRPSMSAGHLEAGNYLSAATGRFLSLKDVDGQVAIDLDGVAMPLRYDVDGTGWFQSNLMKGSFLKQNGKALEWHEFGATDLLELVGPPVGDVAAVVPGHYRSAEAGAEAEVRGDATLHIRTEFGRASYGLKRKGEFIWTLVSPSQGWIGTLERTDDAILLSTLRIRRLRFQKAA